MARRRGRPVDGILLLDKPAGMTSNRALQIVKRVYSAAKAGHTGSLDPLATGVLPICLGEATKFSQYLLEADKAYRTTVVLGVTTTTSDADGEVTATVDASGVTSVQVEAALAPLRGAIEQVPSMYSAIKRDGQPLYKLARAGIEVERAPRQVTVHELVLEAFRPGAQAEADLLVRCSKGTYIRSIAEDLGSALGCGGHVAMLRRIASAGFDESQCVTLAALEALGEREALAELDALLQPCEIAVAAMPRVELGEQAGFYVRQGQAVRVAGAPAAGWVQLHETTDGFVGIGEVLDDGRIAPRRLVNRQQGAAG